MILKVALRRCVFTLLPLCVIGYHASGAAADGDNFIERAKTKGHFILMRHALAPGTGDPDSFELGDCSTQRNLSNTGREQARKIGKTLRLEGMEKAVVYTSQWCRCMDTAKLLNFGEPAPLPALNSFFQTPGLAERSNNALKQFIAEHQWQSPVIMVTHQVNITKLTGVFPRSGELVLLKRSDDGLTVVAREILH